MSKTMQREQIELQGIQFPTSIREDGASVEVIQVSGSEVFREFDKWLDENHHSAERPWGIISQAKSKDEKFFLALSFRKLLRTRFKIQSGRLSKQQEEATEAEVGEFHLRRDGLLELYSVPTKQRNMVLQSIGEFLGGKETVSMLALSKESMTSLMKDAADVGSVSLTGIGNPFFSDVTLSGNDPVNSRTFKELVPNASIKSFRGKFQLEVESDGDGNSSSVVPVTIYSNCKLRFYAVQSALNQPSIEQFISNVRKLASANSD